MANVPPDGQTEHLSERLRQLAGLFLKLGATGFGGPAPVIGMIDDETVSRRGWLTREEFLDLMGLTNLIPGPNSTEMAMHIGYLRAGWPGLIVAGAAFILPAALISGGLAWIYVRYGSLPQVAPFLYGVKPVVLAVILGAVYRLLGTAIRPGKGPARRISWTLVLVGLGVLAASLLGVNEVLALLGGGILGMLLLKGPELARGGRRRPGSGLLGLAAPVLAAPHALFTASAAFATAAAEVSLWQLGLFFLKIGAILYGSGYVLVAFLEGGLVQQYHWLTQQQLLDAIAVGQFTPGPVLSTATFIGYLLAGAPGAVISTVAIFFPSFLYVGALNPLIPRLRRSAWMSAFLAAVNVSAVALMAAVTVKLAQSTLTDGVAVLIALLALILSIVWKVNATWLILGGALLGWVLG